MTKNGNAIARRIHLLMLPPAHVLPETDRLIFQAMNFVSSLPANVRNYEH